MRSRSVIVIQVGSEGATERAFIEHEHMVQALPPNGTNHPLDVGPLPRGARRGHNFADAHVSHLVLEVLAEDSVAVAQQVARKLVKGKGSPSVPLENLEMSERTGIILLSFPFSECSVLLRHFSPFCPRSFVRVLPSSWRTWRYATKSECCSALRESVRN